MTKQEQKDFNKMVKEILKANTLISNEKLPKHIRLSKDTAATAVIPTYKFAAALQKFTNKYGTKG